MQGSTAAVLCVLALAGAFAAAQPGAKPEAPKSEPGKAEPARTAPAAQPAAGAKKYEAPDGTPMDVVSTSEIKILVEDLRLGDGEEARFGATVTINYHGTLMNGQVFDTTRGKAPVTYPLPRLIAGWQAAIPGMKVGGVRRLTIPYPLAYGEREYPGPDGKPLIPAKSDLIFSIELKGVQNPPAK